MKTYHMQFTGRQVGAIGAFEKCERTIEAETEAAATTALYDTHEHITGLKVTELAPLEVAKVISTQIGQRAFVMMGSLDTPLLGDKDSLTFTVRGTKVCNRIRVALDPAADLYNVTFYKCRGVESKIVEFRELIDAESLNHVIETVTGLCLSL